MRHDIIFNYNDLIQAIQDKYKASTINKNINLLCKDICYLTPYRFKQVVINKRAYFLQNEIYKISKVLNLTDKEIIKYFYTIKEDNYYD